MKDNTADLAADMLRQKLGSFQGVTEPQDDLNPGKQELRVSSTPLARRTGVSLQTIAFQLRYRIRGQEAMRLQRGSDEVRLFVRSPDATLNNLNTLRTLRIKTAKGGSIPLHLLANWHKTRDNKVIRRMERKRIATIFAKLDTTKGSRTNILQTLRQGPFRH